MTDSSESTAFQTTKPTGPQGLRMLADWFDLPSVQARNPNWSDDDEVQRDLRQWADDMERAFNALEEIYRDVGVGGIGPMIAAKALRRGVWADD